MRPVTTTSAPPEPTVDDLDGIIRQLETSWTATLTVRRQSKDDVGLRQIYVSLDGERIAVLCAGQEVTREIKPGPHRLRIHNTLFWKTLDFSVAVNAHVGFSTINRAGFLTFSIFAFFIGTNVLYLSVERDQPRHSRGLTGAASTAR
jgi:hypothetical protein